eukprot:SAG22_NODE_60_length_23423_cov_8.445250_15_plen_92_part_00
MPAVVEYTLDPKTDLCLVLCCDGALEPEEGDAQWIAAMLQQLWVNELDRGGRLGETEAARIAAAIAESAIEQGSGDNVSVLVAFLEFNPGK